jgi:hypothetical protein
MHVIFPIFYISIFIFFGGYLYLYLTQKEKVNWLEFIGLGFLLSMITVTIVNQILLEIMKYSIITVLRIDVILMLIGFVILISHKRYVKINFENREFLLPLIISVFLFYNSITFFQNQPNVNEKYSEYWSDILQFSILSNNLVEYGMSENQIMTGTRLNYYWLFFSHVGSISSLTSVENIQLHALYYPILAYLIFVISYINFVKELGGNIRSTIIGFISILISGAILTTNFTNLINFVSLSNILGISILLNLIIATKYCLTKPNFWNSIYYLILALGLSLTKTPMMIPILIAINVTLFIGLLTKSYFFIKLLKLSLITNLLFLLTYFTLFLDADHSNDLHLGNGFSETLFSSPFYEFKFENLHFNLTLFLIGTIIIILKIPGLILTKYTSLIDSPVSLIIYLNFFAGLIFAGFLYHAGGSNFHFLLSGVIPIVHFSSTLLDQGFKENDLSKVDFLKILSVFVLFSLWYTFIFLTENKFTIYQVLFYKFLGPIIIIFYLIVLYRRNKNKIVLALFSLSIFIGICFQLNLNLLPYNIYRELFIQESSSNNIDYYDTSNGVSKDHILAFDWIQKNTSTSSIFITNRFCVRRVSPPSSRPPFCQGDTFVLSAYSKRKVYIEGYRAESNTLEQIRPLVLQRVNQSLNFIENPNQNLLNELQLSGVNWVFVDKNFPYNLSLLLFGSPAFENDKVLIINIKST